MRQIVISQRGWVFVGDVTRTGNEVVIENAAVVRRCDLVQDEVNRIIERDFESESH